MCVRLGPQEWTIPALPASDWLAVLMVEDIEPDDIFPGLLEQSDADRVEDLLTSGEMSLDDIYEAFFDIIEAVSSRYWWVALRLIHIAFDQWHVLGPDMVMRGADANQLSLSAWLDSLTVTVVQGMKREQVTTFTMQLEAPPVGETIPEEDMGMSADAFLSMG